MKHVKEPCSLKSNNNAFQGSIPKSKFKAGSLEGKIEVRINDRTVIYLDCNKSLSEIEKIRQAYQFA